MMVLWTAFSRFGDVVSADVLFMVLATAVSLQVMPLVVAFTASFSSSVRRPPPPPCHECTLCSWSKSSSLLSHIVDKKNNNNGGGARRRATPTPTPNIHLSPSPPPDEKAEKEEEEDSYEKYKKTWFGLGPPIVHASRQIGAGNPNLLVNASTKLGTKLERGIVKASNNFRKGIMGGFGLFGVFYLVVGVLYLPTERWKEIGKFVTACAEHIMANKILFVMVVIVLFVSGAPLALVRVQSVIKWWWSSWSSLRWWGIGGGTSSQSSDYDE
jgi:hypothetical protein